MNKIETKELLIYTGLIVEKQLSKEPVDFSYVDRMFVVTNFGYNFGDVLGEVQALYKDKGTIKARIALYKSVLFKDVSEKQQSKENKELFVQQIKENKQLFIQAFENLVPAIGAMRIKDKPVKITTISLGTNNVDPTILSIKQQLDNGKIK